MGFPSPLCVLGGGSSGLLMGLEGDREPLKGWERGGIL